MKENAIFVTSIPQREWGFYINILLCLYYEPYPATDNQGGCKRSLYTRSKDRKKKYMKPDAAEIIKSIREVYERDTFTMGELADILTASGYKKHEIRQIVRSAIKCNEMGKVTYKNIGRSIPNRNTYLVLRPKPKTNHKDTEE